MFLSKMHMKVRAGLWFLMFTNGWDYSLMILVRWKFPQIFQNEPRGLYFSKVLFEGLICGRAYIRRESCLTKSTITFWRDWLRRETNSKASQSREVSAVRIYVFSSLWLEGNLGATVLLFLCLVLYFRTIFKCKPQGASIRRKDLTEGFYVTGLAGLY